MLITKKRSMRQNVRNDILWTLYRSDTKSCAIEELCQSSGCSKRLVGSVLRELVRAGKVREVSTMRCTPESRVSIIRYRLVDRHQ